MILKLTDHDPRQQTDCSHATIYDCRRNGFSSHCFTRSAGILRANMAMYKKFSRLYIKLLCDVFTDFDQILSTLATST